MKNMKYTALSLVLLTGLSAPALATLANSHSDDKMSKDAKSSVAMKDKNNWENQARDAWIDGKAEATLLFNGNLNSFNIDTDVAQGVVTLTGRVDTNTNRELAEELLLGIEGVSKVTNNLMVNKKMDESSETASTFTDAKIVTVVKSRFLFDSEVSGMDINVDVTNRVVTLNGNVESESARDLAEAIARNTNDVAEVRNMLKIKKPIS
jgi:osmotically-inducible protein OsmY